MSKIILLIVILPFVSRFITAFPVADAGEELNTPAKIKIPAMVRKAGGRIRPELLKGAFPDATKEKNISENVKHADEVYDYGVWSSSSEEEDCPKRTYYHIRGKQCVPMRCHGGNKWRNQMTGECMNDNAELHGSTGRKVIWQGRGQGMIAQNGHSRLSPSVWRKTHYYKYATRLQVVRG